MTEALTSYPNHYQTPSGVVLQNRKAFYLSQKESAEPITQWFHRIRDAIEDCNFGTLTDFLVIDKFFSGLDSDEIRWMRRTDSWSLDQLFQAVIDPKSPSIKNQRIDVDTEQSTVINEFLKVELVDIGNDESFFDTNAVSSDSDDDQQLSELKRQIEAEKNAKEILPPEASNGNRKRETQKSKSIKTDGEIKGFEIDAENRYHCLDCGKMFKHKASYTQHQRLHTGKNLLHCKICPKVFMKPSKLKSHYLKHEREQSVAGKSFECHLCKFQFLRVQGLRIHIKLKHVSNIRNDSFQCSYCNEVFRQQIKLDDHLRSKHHLNIAHKCPHCDQIFEHDHLSELKEHLLTHSELKPFMCEVCGNAFKTRRQLHLHMARHTDERRFKCAECGQMLKSRSNYKNHMRQHTGERPFICGHNECGKTFVQRANYLKHLRWHSGDRPHKCSMCEKRFPTAYDMKLHVNSIHTGFKPFQCEICESKFSQPSTLRVHRLRVHR